MGELQFDQALLDEVAHRLDLRDPNMEAIRSVALLTSQHYDVDQKPGPYECIVDSATGVGKTYVMAGLMEYLAGTETPARNFLLLAPGRTIRDKSIHNFTRGHRKSLTEGLRSRPVVITAENFDTEAAFDSMKNPAITKLYVFTVQALTSATGEGRATHDFDENLGMSFYEHLAGLDDLVILADEYHCYRGPAFSKTIDNLDPELVIGLTATPAKRDEKLIAFRYPLSGAIADRLVKSPLLVARRDDRRDPLTQLLDGVNLLRIKARLADAYCQEQGLPPVNPAMLVIAQTIAEAEEYRDLIDSSSFDGGAWVGTTLLVHSKLTGDEKENALAELDAVEDPNSRVRVILNVGMLKEGWDVKNVYVIASMRASASEVMTEQTLGRGLRLPFGSYTGIEMLDTLDVLAHEKYQDLLKKRDVLNQAFINWETRAAVRRLADGSTVVRKEVSGDEGDVIGPPFATTTDPTGDTTENSGGPPSKPTTVGDADNDLHGVVDMDARTRQAELDAEQIVAPIDYEPLVGRPKILIPKIESIAQTAAVSLNDIDLADYGTFEALGRALVHDNTDELRRTRITATRKGDKIVMGTETAQDSVQAALSLDIPLDESRKGLVKRILSVPGVQTRAAEVGAAERIVSTLIAAMGADAGAFLSVFGARAGQQLVERVTRAVREASSAQVTYEDDVTQVALDKKRTARKAQSAGHADGSFSKATAFNGWEKNLYSHAWFDTKPEFDAANAIDNPKNDVIVWARLHINDVPITWTGEGRRYNPDFVVIEEVNGLRIGWLVETKMNREIDHHEVIAKRKAARKWANTVNAFPDVEVEWRYLLLREDDVYDAQGSWEQMKGFGS